SVPPAAHVIRQVVFEMARLSRMNRPRSWPASPPPETTKVPAGQVQSTIEPALIAHGAAIAEPCTLKNMRLPATGPAASALAVAAVVAVVAELALTAWSASTAYGTAPSLVRPTEAPSISTSIHRSGLARTIVVQLSPSEAWNAPPTSDTEAAALLHNAVPPV